MFKVYIINMTREQTYKGHGAETRVCSRLSLFYFTSILACFGSLEPLHALLENKCDLLQATVWNNDLKC